MNSLRQLNFTILLTSITPTHASIFQVDKASNGVALAAQEGTNSLARVVCAVRAGSRYEDSSERGAAHCLRALSDLTQREVRSFALTRSLQQMGANITYVIICIYYV